MPRWKRTPRFLPLPVNPWTEECKTADPLPALYINKATASCGLCVRKCPYCVYHCFGNDDVFFHHLFQLHVDSVAVSHEYTSSRSYHGQIRQAVPPATLTSWCREARQLMTTVNCAHFAHLKVTLRASNGTFYLALCPFCLQQCSLFHLASQHLSYLVQSDYVIPCK